MTVNQKVACGSLKSARFVVRNWLSRQKLTKRLVCVYTMRGSDEDPIRWIISLRKANRGESHAYRTAFPR